MAGGGQYPQSPRPNSPFQGGNNVQGRPRFNSPNNAYDGFSDFSPSSQTDRYFSHNPGRFNFYGPSDETRINSDNPLYEIDENAMFGFNDQNDVSTNPLYGDELYTDQIVDLGNFLRPRDVRFDNNNPDRDESPERDDMEVNELIQSWIRSPRSPAIAAEQSSSPSPITVFRSNPLPPDGGSSNLPPGQDPYQNGSGNVNPIEPNFLQENTDESPDLDLTSLKPNGPRPVRTLRVIPPSRLTPLQPPCPVDRSCEIPFSSSPPREPRKLVTSKDRISPPSITSKPPLRGKPGRWYQPSSSTSKQPQPVPLRRPHLPPMNFAVQNVKDLVAALRSDRTLFKAEVRKDGAREPRVPGDHDRYFAPRKGDIIVHSTPTDDFDQKLVEYFDPQKTLPRIQPGDKLVRVKYDNQRIPDHLMITCKLYAYAPEWIYLGKALQTIKTA